MPNQGKIKADKRKRESNRNKQTSKMPNPNLPMDLSIKMRLLKQLCWGVILFLAGAGILIGTMYTADNVSMFIGGGILVACGVALLVTFAVGKKWLEPEIMAEEKGAVDKSRTDGKEPGQGDAEL